jgi:NAD(P)-dependent dehydrogenase (short-subunit alcohol dehydrogenase family)
MYGLEGRKAIITGGAYGIGRGIAQRLLAEGCDVGLFDLDREAAEACAQESAVPGRRIFVASGDVSKKEDVEAGIGQLMRELGSVDILVNNAGICRVGKFLEMSDADWHATFGINVDGMFYVTRLVAPGMVERKSGTIVNLASWMGKSGVAAYGAYCASKFAVVGLTQSLACELGEHGIRVNAVAPGMIVNTRMRDESEALRKEQGLPLADERAQAIPIRRPGIPEDLAKAVLFLVSEQSSYITGETISVTGGLWND